ncbi:hypothetical protein Drorol1_Dr00006573 [Drosera rotundifolia]
MELQGVLQSSPFIGLSATPTSRRYLLSMMATPNSPALFHFSSQSSPFGSRQPKPLWIRTRPLQSSPSASTTKPSLTATSNNLNPKDQDLVFVAGATGRVGSRTVRELLKLGFRVRAGVRDVQRAETLIQSVRQMKLDTEFATEGVQYVEKLDIVECDLEKPEEIGVALGNAWVVICCIGASEKEVFDVTGPYRIDYQASKNLIDAATVAKVGHFIFVSSLGTNKVGFPAAILNLFWGVLIWKRKAEVALISSGLPYTIVRPGGMERPTDSYKETHNVNLSLEDTLFGGQVSNLQVAELIAYMAKNPSVSFYKVVEVIAETTAPLRPFRELLLEIPSRSTVVYSSKELGASRNMDPVFTFSDAPNTPSEKKPVDDDSLIKGPMSLYTAYEDLKPPSSPKPNPPGQQGKATLDSSVMEAPPPSLGENGAPDIVTAIGNGSVQELAYPCSPYHVYDDLKPPTSPSPRAPNSLSA